MAVEARAAVGGHADVQGQHAAVDEPVAELAGHLALRLARDRVRQVASRAWATVWPSGQWQACS